MSALLTLVSTPLNVGTETELLSAFVLPGLRDCDANGTRTNVDQTLVKTKECASMKRRDFPACARQVSLEKGYLFHLTKYDLTPSIFAIEIGLMFAVWYFPGSLR